MSRFIAVIHRWHVESRGFRVYDLAQQEAGQAEAEAALLAMGNQATCQRADYHLVEIGDRECLLPRRLTWKERLTGVLRP